MSVHYNMESLQRLPPWACVAFAARCAQRAGQIIEVPSFFRPIARKRFAEDIARKAEKTAAGLPPPSEVDIEWCFSQEKKVDGPAKNVHVAVAYAAKCARNAFKELNGRKAAELSTNTVHLAFLSVQSAILAVEQYNFDLQRVIILAVDWDYSLLQSIAKAENRPRDALCPESICGSLWPFGDSFTTNRVQEAYGKYELVVTIEMPEGADDRQMIHQVEELAESLDGLHRAYGGHGLQVETLEVLNECPEHEGVPS